MKSIMSKWFWSLLITAVMVGGAALAQTEPAAAAPVFNSGDVAWMMTSTALVLLMTIPGLALFYAGMVRKTNVLATLMQVFSTCALVTVLWIVIGYSLSFSAGTNDYVGGFSRMLLAGMTATSVHPLAPSIPESLFMLFQMTFAIITPALIVGAFAERMKFSSLLIFMALWLVLVYSPIAYMVWGGGLMTKMGVLDFAGGAVVHINAGIAGLIAALVVGKRRDYGAAQFLPNNLVLTMLGASLLWIGWFGFNGGSALTAGSRAAMAITVTHVATAAATLSWMFAEWIIRKKPSVTGALSGAVAGLVAITPASGFVDPAGAVVIGIVSGLLCLYACIGLKKALGYDDTLDVFGIHGVAGVAGAVLTGVFAMKEIGGVSGWVEGNFPQVITQLYGVGITIVYSAVVTFVILQVVRMLTGGLRVHEEVEMQGLDKPVHGEAVH